MSSTADVVQLMKTQKKILTEIENLTRDFKNKDPSCFNGLQVSESSNTYTISGRIDPFLRRNIKVYFSKDEKFLIMDASHETLFDRYTTSHQMVRKFRIDDKYNLKSMHYEIIDNFITIRIKAEDQSFDEREEAPEEQVSRKEKEQYMKAAADLDLDMTTTSEGELLPRYVVERTTIDPEVLQRKIEIPPDLYFSEIDEAYVQFREDELEPCPEFERQIEEMARKRLEEKLAERKAIATSQSMSVPEDTDHSQSTSDPKDTDTSIRMEKPVGEVTEQKSGVQRQEIADDPEEAGDEKRLEVETEGEDDDETQKKSHDKKTEEEVEDVVESIEETKKKTDDVKQPETASRQEERDKKETLSEASKKRKGKQPATHGAEEKDTKYLEKSERETPTKQERESKESLPESTMARVKQQEEKRLEVEKKDDADSREIAPEIPPKVSIQPTDEGEEKDDKDSKETVPEIPAKGSKHDPDEGEKTGDIPPKVLRQQPDEGEEPDVKVSKETVTKTPPRASKQQTDEGDKADSRETTPGTPSSLPPVEEKQSEEKGGAKGFNGLQVSESSNRFTITGRIDPCLNHSIKLYFSEDKKYLIVAASETLSGHYATFHKMERKFRIEDKYNLNSVQYDITDDFFTITIEADDQIFSEREEAPDEQGTRKESL